MPRLQWRVNQNKDGKTASMSNAISVNVSGVSLVKEPSIIGP